MRASRGRTGSGVADTVGAFNFIRRIGFPSTTEVLSIFAGITILPAAVALPSSGMSLSMSLWVPVAVAILPAILGELVNSSVFLRADPVLNFRRLMGLELLSWWTLILLLPLSSLIGLWADNPNLWNYGLIVSLAVSLPLRFLTVFAISPLGSPRKVAAGTITPAITFLVYAALSPPTSAALVVAGALVLVLGTTLSAVGVSMIVRNVDNSGTPQIGDSPMALFRAFLQHWLKADPKPLEDRLASLGAKGRIGTAVLAFESNSKSSKGCIVVSNFHPGPYRDLGSGGLPSTLKSAVESAMGTVALVPHGISNHEYNIISHQDAERLVSATKTNYPADATLRTASRIVRAEVEEAKASAQAFGNILLVTLTLAPHDMEDIPEEVLSDIQAYALGKGFQVIVIDTHNSLSSLSGQTSITPGQARKLTEAANRALDLVSKLPQNPFRAGFSSDTLDEFGIEDGIGPGGLSVSAVDAGGQLAAYFTIDGNNMETGFRQRIFDGLRERGLDDGEVMTTDTHLVTGLVRSPLGYHPVGEHINRELLVGKVLETFERAKKNMAEASAGFSHFDLDLLVLGSTTFQSITSFVAAVARRIGRSFFELELAATALALMLLIVV